MICCGLLDRDEAVSDEGAGLAPAQDDGLVLSIVLYTVWAHCC